MAWTEVRLNAWDYDASGKAKVVNGSSYFVMKSPFSGAVTATGSGWDPGRSCVISWRTAGRGPRNRGRTYVPAHGLSTTAGVIPIADRNLYGNAGRTLHTTVEGLPYVGHAVVSRKWKTYSAITSIEVGDELDGQRRRRTDRPEVYTRY